jgi:SagB-type dehydrogenase family enzyme
MTMGSLALDALQALAAAGVLEDVVVGDLGQDLAAAHRPILHVGCRIADRRLRLGEHVFVRPLPTDWVVMQPSTPTWIALRSEVAGPCLCSLAAGSNAARLSEVELLFLDNGFLTVDEEPAQFSWEFHDAVFHGASAHGYGTDRGYGATSAKSASLLKRLSDRLPLTNGRMIDLAEAGTYPCGMEVMARRRTRREFSARPVSWHSLGSLLGLALRTQSVAYVSPMEYYALHPYPSGGARDEIMTLLARAHDAQDEAFLAVYLNREHKLFRYYQSQELALEAIKALSAVCHVGKTRPSVALLFTADYERMATKYEAIAYATMLRNVGAIYQTVSLVAEALNLATCAVGGGWGHLERQTLSGHLAGRVIVGGMLVGVPAGQPGHEHLV